MDALRLMVQSRSDSLTDGAKTHRSSKEGAPDPIRGRGKMTNIQSAIQAMLASGTVDETHALHRPPKPVIALSRDHGALGRQIANAVAAKLDIPVYDREILDKIAKRLDTDPQTIKMLDECVARARHMWLMRLFTGKNLTEDAYRDQLINVILSLGRNGGVILGRGAHVILATSCALRLRIIASPAIRKQRVADRYGITLQEAEQQIEEIDANRGRFVWELFHHRNSDATGFDLVINTDRLTSIDDAANIVIEAYKAIAESTVPVTKA
jgi:cytidylate kinase